MYMKVIISFIFIVLLFGCGQNDTSSRDQPEHNLDRLSSQSSQDTADEAKKQLLKNEEIEAVQAVNTSDTLLITIEIPHHERFSLQKKREQYQKELEKTFPHFTIELSTDKKIILELADLEEKIKQGELTEKQMEKEVKKVVELSKEQT